MDRPPETRRRRVADELVELVQRLSIASRHVAHAFASRQGLHQTDLEALLHVMRAEARNEPMTAGDLAEALGLTSGATTGVIDRLGRTGHLDRRRDEGDRRKVHLHHSDPGQAVALEFFGPLGRRNDEALAPFTVEELEVARRVLAAITEAMARHAAEAT